MKRMVFAALAALLWAGQAGAATETQDGQRTYTMQGVLVNGMVRADTTAKNLTMSDTGGLYTADESRDRDFVRLWDNEIDNASLAAAAGDSMLAPIDVGAYRYLKLLVKCTPIGPAVNTTVRLAFQFREHLNAAVDTMSVFAEYQYGVFPVGSITASSRSDTTIAGHLVTPSVPATEAWSGEHVVTFNMNRSAPGSGVAANVWSYPNGVAIPFDSFFGRPARFKYLSVRVRNLNLSGPAVKIVVSILGFAQ